MVNSIHDHTVHHFQRFMIKGTQTFKGNAQLLDEKWKFIVHHIHEWDNDPKRMFASSTVNVRNKSAITFNTIVSNCIYGQDHHKE